MIMEYPTPNPGPCRSCGKRIWHGGELCTNCRQARSRRYAKADRDAATVKRLKKQLAAAKAQNESQVLHPLSSDGKPNKAHTYCHSCGRGVRDQKYCHGCGRKLVWTDIEQRTCAVYEKLAGRQDVRDSRV